jgi:hypothetical protein
MLRVNHLKRVEDGRKLLTGRWVSVHFSSATPLGQLLATTAIKTSLAIGLRAKQYEFSKFEAAIMCGFS